MKLYIVKYSIGQWEDYSLYIAAVFDNENDAKKQVHLITLYYDELKSKEPPYDEGDYMNEKLTEEQEEEFSRWRNNKYEADDFNNAYIDTIELNQFNEEFNP